MMNLVVCNTLSRLTINNALAPFRSISINAPLYLNCTSVLYAEPLKKKKKIDPAIIRQREERKKKKLEKFIRRLEKNEGILKPIEELEVPKELKTELFRRRDNPKLSAEELNERLLLFKDWNRYKSAQHREHAKLIRSCMSAQLNALEKLKEISNDLYLEAIRIDTSLLPYSTKGPVHTPPIDDYQPPHGDYINVQKDFK